MLNSRVWLSKGTSSTRVQNLAMLLHHWGKGPLYLRGIRMERMVLNLAQVWTRRWQMEGPSRTVFGGMVQPRWTPVLRGFIRRGQKDADNWTREHLSNSTTLTPQHGKQHFHLGSHPSLFSQGVFMEKSLGSETILWRRSLDHGQFYREGPWFRGNIPKTGWDQYHCHFSASSYIWWKIKPGQKTNRERRNRLIKYFDCPSFLSHLPDFDSFKNAEGSSVAAPSVLQILNWHSIKS